MLYHFKEDIVCFVARLFVVHQQQTSGSLATHRLWKAYTKEQSAYSVCVSKPKTSFLYIAHSCFMLELVAGSFISGRNQIST